ncbi:MAG: B12-binding domain-containing protein [Candidatus Hodarchaeota archaeon]
MKNKETLTRIKNSVVEGDSQKTIDFVNEALNIGLDYKDILNGAIIKGAIEVGELYEQEKYFLADMLMTGDAINAAIDLLKNSFIEVSAISKGDILIGTVEGDIHDIGKCLVVSLLKGQGFNVIDLGSDVPPEEFVQKAKEIKPDIIGLSGLLTMSISKMHETILLLKKENISSKIIIGGGIVSKDSCAMIGADDCAKDGWEGVKKIRNLISEFRGG